MDESGGLGRAPATPIVALPPLEKRSADVRLDPATGEPARGATIALAYAALLAAGCAAAAGLGLTWWRAIHMDTFPVSARLVEWTHPNPGSPASIGIAIAVMATGVILTAAPVLAGYLGWVGRPAARWWALAAVAVGALTLLITPNGPLVQWGNVGWLTVPLALIGAILVWLPASQRRLRDWQTFRAPRSPAPPGTRVAYGRLEQFR